jgi:hypothetical protein
MLNLLLSFSNSAGNSWWDFPSGNQSLRPA